jgi:hypothetical protein
MLDSISALVLTVSDHVSPANREEELSRRATGHCRWEPTVMRASFDA